MKISRLIIFAAMLALAAGCATSPRTAGITWPTEAAATQAAQSRPTVISAIYGSGRTFIDVTSRVKELLQQSPGGFRARPGRMLVDPTPDTTAILVIVYEYNGQRHTLTKGQRGKVSIQILEDAAKKDA